MIRIAPSGRLRILRKLIVGLEDSTNRTAGSFTTTIPAAAVRGGPVIRSIRDRYVVGMGRTPDALRRHVVATQIVHIGKEANKWEEGYFLGGDEGAEIEYGALEIAAFLDRKIRDLCDARGERAAATQAPATSSNRTSARWRFAPFVSVRVRR
jgi:hypothetical protein